MKTKSSRTRRSRQSREAPLPNRGVQLVLGVLFIATGVLLTASFLMTVNQMVRSGSWVETPCETTTEKVVRRKKWEPRDKVVSYRWQWEGKWYQSDTLRFPGFFGGSPEAGSELARAPQQSPDDAGAPQEKSRCLVNPWTPAEAVYYRGMDGSTALIHLVGMTGLPYIGLLMLVAVCIGRPQQVKDRAARARNPDVPYFWRDDWERGVVEDRSRRSDGVIAKYALFWTCPVAAVIAVLILSAEGHGLRGPLVAAVIAGLVSVVAAGKALRLGFGQFGRLVIEPVGFPPCAGYLLEGTIKLPRRLRKRARVAGIITVTRLMQTSKDGLQPVPLATVPADVTAEGRVLTIAAALPDAPPASPDGTPLPVTWTLVLVAAGDSLKATFELPVARAG